MIEFINIYNEKINSIGSKPAFVDGNTSMSYKQLDISSAKIYNYLKSHGVGREDFVQVVLSRSVKIPAVVMGVVKAGAAFMVLEDTYPSDRIEYIYKDCKCVLRIDDTLYDEIMETVEPLSGCEDMDPHDACYAVYTSGSTGNPKGVLHEYGNIKQNCDSFDTWYDEDITNSAIFAPFYFVAGILDIFHYISRGRTTYIVPHDMTRDFVAVKQFIIDNNIQEIFLPPSYLKIYTEPSPTLKVLYTGSEPANGLSYYDNPTLINFYAMSESGFVTLQANLNRPYDVAPVGKPLLDEIKVCLLDEEGQVIEGAGRGELCFVNEYVRGYINLPEQTDKTWRDGLYHTNDCVRRDEEGNYYLIGRYDDMIKINGNRVEPVEIENHIKKITGLKQVVAKGFKIDNRTFICAYYVENEAESLGIYSNGELTVDMKVLEDLLPDYMIPTYYIPMEAFPLLPNGKIARKSFMPPDTNDIASEYIPPSNELEEKICNVYSQVLKLDKVGTSDDFYTIGGDSMSAIVAAARFSDIGLNIDTKAIYNSRTPGALAAFYSANKEKLSKKPRRYDNKRALEIPNYSGKAFLKPTKEGRGGIFKYHMKSPVDSNCLSVAYEKVIKNYPFFGLTFEEKGDNVYYKELGYIPMVRPISEYKMEDHEGKPLIEIFYQDNAIIISYFHVLTDGEGFFFFARTLLHEYVNEMKGIEEESVIRDFDYSYDVMSRKLDVEGEYRVYDLPDTFEPPEYDKANEKLKTYKIGLSRKDWLSVVSRFINEYSLEGIRKLQVIGGEDAFVAGHTFLKAFAKVHPDAELPLMCRFPMNMRPALDRENTLRNCAMPQAFYNVLAGDLLDDRMAVVNTYERIAAQTSADNVKMEVNRLIGFMESKTQTIEDDPVYNYIKEATVLATNLGNIASVRDAEYITDFSIGFKPTCYASIQSCVKGREQVLIVNQLFEDDVYVRELVSDLSCEGRFDIKLSEV